MRQLIYALFLLIVSANPATAASVDGIPIFSTVEGSGATIIFVHGWTCDVSSWREQSSIFADGYQSIAIDLPGHGRSGTIAEDNFSMALFARAVEAVRNESGGDKVVLVGHSMGVVVIRKYALLYPEHVAGLVAVDGPMDMTAFAAQFEDQTVNMSHETRERFIRSMFIDDTPMSLREDILHMMLRPPTATANGAAAAMLDPEMRNPAMIDAPTLVVVAGTATIPDAEMLSGIHSNIDTIQMDGTGHFLMMEKPAEFNGILRQFLESVDIE